VALVATLTANFVIRSKHHTKVEVTATSPLHRFYLQDSLLKVDTVTHVKQAFIKDWDYYHDHDAKEFYPNPKDSNKVAITLLVYTNDDDTCFGVFNSATKQWYYSFDEVYLQPSSADTIAYQCSKKLVYDIPKNKWTAGLTQPRIMSITILYIPPTEYAKIPNSLIRKLPF